jgi:hypothetical protein
MRYREQPPGELNAMDDVPKALAGAVLGAITVWVTNALNERRKVESERRISLRNTLAEWLTAASMLKTQIRMLINAVSGLPQSRDHYEVVLEETKNVLSFVKDCLHTCNKVYLLDKNLQRREILNGLTTQLENCSRLLFMHASHFEVHIKTREDFAQLEARNKSIETSLKDMSPEFATVRLEELSKIKGDISRLKLETDEHDKTCESKTSKSLVEMEKSVDYIESKIEECKKLFAGTM